MTTQSAVIVVKIGGTALGASDTSLADVAALQRHGHCPVVVHGGGPLVTQWMAKLGIRAEFVDGLRVTDAPSLEVVSAVLAGMVNKQLVSMLSGLGAQVVGISGADGAMLRGKVGQPNLGLVASEVEVDPRPVQTLLNAGYIPVIAPLALGNTHDAGPGHQLLNVNADTVAGALAVALGASRLVFLTDVDGILDSSGRVIPRITNQVAEALLTSGVVKGGMVPKMEASLEAAAHKTPAHIINGTAPSALLECVNGAVMGTAIV